MGSADDTQAVYYGVGRCPPLTLVFAGKGGRKEDGMEVDCGAAGVLLCTYGGCSRP